MVTQHRPTAGTAASVLIENDAQRRDPDASSLSFVLKNITATASVFLGDPGVTAANGFEWAPADGPLSIDLEPGEKLYGIVAVTQQALHALQAGR
jgi:hypothetical protein